MKSNSHSPRYLATKFENFEPNGGNQTNMKILSASGFSCWVTYIKLRVISESYVPFSRCFHPRFVSFRTNVDGVGIDIVSRSRRRGWRFSVVLWSATAGWRGPSIYVSTKENLDLIQPTQATSRSRLLLVDDSVCCECGADGCADVQGYSVLCQTFAACIEIVIKYIRCFYQSKV